MKRFLMIRRALVMLLTALLTVLFGVGPVPAATATPTAAAAPAPLTNLAHLDFLLDTTRPVPVAGHSTYQLAQEPGLVMPWTYADARPGGTFERVGGGGPPDPVTGDYAQGAFNVDDTARAAVVYLRHWKLTGDRTSRRTAYELLRSVGYHQTLSGPNAGNVVLWMQPDGDLNPSAEPVEQPDPSDSGDSYWLARTIWAYGEGYAAFKRSDPAFAAFLRARLRLSLRALDREVFGSYGRYVISDGRRVPAWLIADGADASAEAVLGLAAYVRTEPADPAARRALSRLATGVAAMSRGDADSWPYGAILPWAKSPSLWHAWGSQMSSALVAASAVLRDRSLLRPAVREAASFDPTLATSNGPDIGWFPTPGDKTQIAYGVDSRVQSLLAVADRTGSRRAERLAAVNAGWYFGANAAGQPTYDPATGVVFDGVSPTGEINRNSGAESTIHGLLSMLALDAHPRVRRLARDVTSVVSRDGLAVVEGEAGTGGTVVTPVQAWTGESLWSGGKYLRLAAGQRATLTVPAAAGPRVLEPVVWTPERSQRTTRWAAGSLALGQVTHRVGAQGISEAPGALLARTVRRTLPADVTQITVEAVGGEVWLDAVIVRPVVSRAVFGGPDGRTVIRHRITGR